MKLCPHCREVVNLHIGMYRCGHCHLWLEAEECLDVERVSLLEEQTAPFVVRKLQALELPSGDR